MTRTQQIEKLYKLYGKPLGDKKPYNPKVKKPTRRIRPIVKKDRIGAYIKWKF